MIDMKHEKDLEGLEKTSTTSHPNDTQHNAVQTHDDVFGEITEHGPNYRNVRIYSAILVFGLTPLLPNEKQNQKISN